MTTSKIVVHLPDELVARARHAVSRGRAQSVSAYVAAALEEKVKLDDLEQLLSDMLEETGGPLTRAERRAAAAAFDQRPSPKRRRGTRSFPLPPGARGKAEA
jgi:Arc/MetJ-type ribon-helix-helix transcriptional regulator